MTNKPPPGLRISLRSDARGAGVTDLATAFRDAGLVQFDPTSARVKDAKTDSVIDYAKRPKAEDRPRQRLKLDAMSAG